jgi:hypothetical protein
MSNPLRKAIQNSINNYNMWASRRASAFTPNKGRKDRYSRDVEFRGIIYNKLMTEVKTVNVSSEAESGIPKAWLSPDDLKCTFNEQGFLTHLEFVRPNTYTYNGRYSTLCNLQTEVVHCVYRFHSEEAHYQITDCVSNIENFII